MAEERKYQIGWVIFFMGFGLLVACLPGYLSPGINMIRTGNLEWHGWLVLSLAGERVDIGPALVGTLGGLFLYLGKRYRSDACSRQHLHLTTLANKARESGDAEDLQRFEAEKAVFLRFRKHELRYLYVVSGFNLLLLAIFLTAAVWCYSKQIGFYWFFGILAALMALRTWLDWPARQSARG